jgi:lysophospholipase L1-like esterase
MQGTFGKIRRLVACLLFGDRVLRMPNALVPHLPRYAPHPYKLFELRRNWVSPDGRIRHNALGFRGPEFAPAKTPGRLRVVCMGESSTYGSGVADDETYPARLQGHLARLLAPRDVEVINAGVLGYTSAENVLHGLFDVAPLAPDLVVYYYTHNDAHARRMPHLSRDYREFSRSWYEPHGSGGLGGALRRRMMLALGDIGQIVRRDDVDGGRRPAANVANNPPDAFAANMAALAAILRDVGARLLFVNPLYRDLDANDAADPAAPGTNLAFRAVWEHRRIVDNLAARLGEGLVDLRGKIPYPGARDAFPSPDYLDPVHFSPAGADRAAAIVAAEILAQNLLPPASESEGLRG